MVCGTIVAYNQPASGMAGSHFGASTAMVLGLGHTVYIALTALIINLVVAVGPIGLVLVDGWKDLRLPVLRLLEPRLAPGALIAADDTTFTRMADYLEYVRDPANGYATVAFPVADGMELSTWTGR
jgi:predicted O-methyltransferase YrrM